MKKKQWIGLTALTALVLTVSVPNALAYFTTYASASGRVEISLEAETEIVENLPGSNMKEVQVQLDPDSQPVYVRVRAFGGSAFPIDVQPGVNWHQAGEYWEYGVPLYPEEGRNITQTIVFSIDYEHNDDAQDFNIIVVSESIPVRFDENGDSLPADWDRTIEIERGEG